MDWSTKISGIAWYIRSSGCCGSAGVKTQPVTIETYISTKRLDCIEELQILLCLSISRLGSKMLNGIQSPTFAYANSIKGTGCSGTTQTSIYKYKDALRDLLKLGRVII